VASGTIVFVGQFGRRGEEDVNNSIIKYIISKYISEAIYI
jgi:hypothetical protein